jgi:hypothetical protein
VGLFAHAAHLHTPDKETAKFLAGALLRSPHAPVIATPYGHWLNVYLPMGLSYKDVPELPTATYVEVNVYDGEGLDLRLYKSDRLAYQFESGVGDAAEEEDQILEIAADLWRKEHPEEKREAAASAVAGDVASEVEEDARKGKDFWTLEKAEQDAYMERARSSGEFAKVRDQTSEESAAPDPADFEGLLPEGRTLEELRALLNGISRRRLGPPANSDERAAIARHMEGKEHSTKAEDYAAAIARFLGLRGSLWSLETILEQRQEKVDRRIVPIDALDAPPSPPRTE